MLRIIFTILAVGITPTLAQSAGALGRSQVNLGSLNGTNEYIQINLVKGGTTWRYKTGLAPARPNDTDANGFPLYGSTGFSHGGYETYFFGPSQAEEPGHQVLSWIGGGRFAIYQIGASATYTNVSCTGAFGSATCDNTGCSAAEGFISGSTLTITSPSSCKFAQGQPISGAGIMVSTFGVPTIITSTNGGHTGTGTYTVNFSQTVGSPKSPITISPGGRYEFSVTSETTITNAQWELVEQATSSGNTAQYFGFYNKNDEATYATGKIVGTLLKQRIAQGNFAVVRDLGVSGGQPDVNLSSNCTTWATRKPTTYWSYYASEMRASLYAGETSYAFSNGSNDYSVTFGSGGPVDKETLIVLWNNTAVSGAGFALTFNLNGAGKAPILSARGAPITSKATYWHSVQGYLATLVYDADLKAWLHHGGPALGNSIGLNCGMPPEAFIELNAELGTNPWIVEYYLAADPITDFYTSYATYIKTNYPNMVPEFEAVDEPWNSLSIPGEYAINKTRAYAALDSAWSSGEAFSANWTGKVASLLGQAISSVYSNSNQYEVIAPIFTNDGYTAGMTGVLLSTSYLNQNPSNIPTQSGYAKTAAYKYVTRVSIWNYWGLSEAGTQQEVADAYNYYNGNASQQAAIMASYMATQRDNISRYQGWHAWAAACAGGGGACAMKSPPLRGYEGGFNINLQNGDQKVAFASATTSGGNCVLSTASGNGIGAVVGQTVAITDGGSSPPYNGLTVQASTGNSITVSGACSTFGTISTGTLTFTGSNNYINYLQKQAYLSSQLYTYTLQHYASFIANGGANPSQFNLGGALWSKNPWTTWSFDIYGYFQLATCSACKISGTTLTLGGTIRGVFGPKQTLFGRGVAGVGTGAATNTTILSVLTGNGKASGDTLRLSQPSTVSSGVNMSGNATPSLDLTGNATNSPIKQWEAIRRWNGDGGGYLLKRDLDPSNDNSPVFVHRAT